MKEDREKNGEKGRKENGKIRKWKDRKRARKE